MKGNTHSEISAKTLRYYMLLDDAAIMLFIHYAPEAIPLRPTLTMTPPSAPSQTPFVTALIITAIATRCFCLASTAEPAGVRWSRYAHVSGGSGGGPGRIDGVTHCRRTLTGTPVPRSRTPSTAVPTARPSAAAAATAATADRPLLSVYRTSPTKQFSAL